MLGDRFLKRLRAAKRKTKESENGEGEAPRSCSAEELPTVKELRCQIAFLKPFAFIFGGLRGMREVKALEDKLDRQTSVIDGFYSLLGDRGWVFSDALSVEQMQLIVEKNNDPSIAEKDLISYLKEGKAIDVALNKLNRYEDMRPRLPLLRKASKDYLEGRYYSVVLVLIAVMDGFVNDFDKTVRRGLHARSPEEMHAEDCVAAMWAGLPAVQRTFVKSFHAREDAEVYSVFRHGMMHGMVTNFDNEVVASKAWCMLFGVCDWADSIALDKEKERERQGKEPLRTSMKRHGESSKKLVEDEKRLGQWSSRPVDLSNPLAEDRELVNACANYFGYWQKGNYGRLAGCLANPAKKPIGKMAGEAREAYSSCAIDQYKIESIERSAAAVADVHVSLKSKKRNWNSCIRFVRMDDNETPCCDWRPGEWKVVRWAVDPFHDECD